MRCNECNRFASYSFDEPPEAESLDVDEAGQVSAEVRIVLSCALDGSELKEGMLRLRADPPPEVVSHIATGDGLHHLYVKELSVGSTEHDEGKGLRRQTFYGAKVGYRITCVCDPNWGHDGEFEASMEAGDMEETF